jgi:hypothetical protein
MPISPRVGEMSGRTEGGELAPPSAIFPQAALSNPAALAIAFKEARPKLW